MIVEFETARLAKERGFEIPMDSNSSYFNECGDIHKLSWFKPKELVNAIPAPTQSELQTWLREVYKIDISVIRQPEYEYKNYYCVSISNFNTGYEYKSSIGLIWVTDRITIGVGEKYTFEEALEKGLQEGLKLIANES